MADGRYRVVFISLPLTNYKATWRRPSKFSLGHCGFVVGNQSERWILQAESSPLARHFDFDLEAHNIPSTLLTSRRWPGYIYLVFPLFFFLYPPVTGQVPSLKKWAFGLQVVSNYVHLCEISTTVHWPAYRMCSHHGTETLTPYLHQSSCNQLLYPVSSITHLHFCVSFRTYGGF